MKGSGPRLERETVQVFNEDGEMMSVWTASEIYYKKLLKLGLLPVRDGQRSAEFIVPKKWARLPRPPRKVSEARKEALKKAGFKPKNTLSTVQ